MNDVAAQPTSQLLSDSQAPLPPLLLPDDAENDNVSRALFFHGLLSAEDCDRILALPEDPHLTSQFLQHQRQLMPGYASYMRCQSQVIPMQAESEWLFAHLHTIMSAVNHRHFHFEADRLMGAQLLTLENGQQLDWHSSIGEGQFATRKLMLVAFLSPDQNYSGGEFELMASPFATMRRAQGMIVVCPAFSVIRIHPVTAGKMQVLVSWLHGTGLFS